MAFRESLVGILRRRKDRLGWSHTTLAERTGLDLSTIGRVFADKNGTFETLERMAIALDVDLLITRTLDALET